MSIQTVHHNRSLTPEERAFAVHNCRIVLGETQTGFAARLRIQQPEVSKMESGKISEPGNTPESRLLRLCSQNTIKFLAHGIDTSALICECNRSKDYPFNFRTQAEALARKSIGRSSQRALCDIRIRGLELPSNIETLVFLDCMNGRRLMFVLVNASLNLADQRVAAFEQIGWFFNREISKASQAVSSLFYIPTTRRRHFSSMEISKNSDVGQMTQNSRVNKQNFIQLLCRITSQIPQCQKLVAAHFKICEQTLSDWKSGVVTRFTFMPENLEKLEQLLELAEPILRLRCIFPHRLELVSPVSSSLAKERLYTILRQAETKFPESPNGLMLDIHCESGRLNDGNHSHFFSNGNKHANLFVILVDENDSLEQRLDEAFTELKIHGITKFGKRAEKIAEPNL